jgi:hypothetical protein
MVRVMASSMSGGRSPYRPVVPAHRAAASSRPCRGAVPRRIRHTDRASRLPRGASSRRCRDRGPLRPARRNYPPAGPVAGGLIPEYKHPVRHIQDRPGHRRPDKPPDRTPPVDRPRPPGLGVTLKKLPERHEGPFMAPIPFRTLLCTAHRSVSHEAHDGGEPRPTRPCPQSTRRQRLLTRPCIRSPALTTVQADPTPGPGRSLVPPCYMVNSRRHSDHGSPAGLRGRLKASDRRT